MVKDIKFDTQNCDDYPTAHYGSFSCLCGGRSIVGGGYDSNDKISKAAFEFDRGEWMAIPSLNSPRSFAAAVFFNNNIVVTGGFGSDGDLLNTIESLCITATDNSPEWVTMPDRLPVEVEGHTISHFRGKLVLIGGYSSSADCRSNEVFEGNMGQNGITWKQVMSLNKARSGHMTINFSNKLIVLGGYNESSCEVYDGNSWKMGPSLPYALYSARAVVDSSNRVIITGGVIGGKQGFNDKWKKYSQFLTIFNDKIIIFYPDNMIFHIVPFFHSILPSMINDKIEPRWQHIALLQ